MDGTFTKQPSEAFNITVDFSERLETGEAIASVATSAVKVSDSSTVTSTVLGTATSASGIVTLPVKAGTSGEDYKIRVVATTDATTPAIHEADVLMRVREG